jgi:hypothetical protein
MNRRNRSVLSACLGVAFVVAGAGASGAAVTSPASSTYVPVTQCNADPGMDASNDPVHCQYEHPLPVPRSQQPAHHHHHG